MADTCSHLDALADATPGDDDCRTSEEAATKASGPVAGGCTSGCAT